MIEQVFELYGGDEKRIEKVLLDENVQVLHMVLPENQGLPVHISNANLYMTVMRGRLTISLGEEAARVYTGGTLLKIPENTKMDAQNRHADTLELLVVKAPAPIQ